MAFALALLAACAPKPIALPSGAGTPYPAYADALASATTTCRDARELTAELGISGRVGRTKLRGRAIVGVVAPDRIRLEALAPFGPPVFVLAAHDGRATLLLPRDDRVLRDAAPEAIVEALAGVRIDPASLRAALSGCALDADAAQGATMYGTEWLAIDLGGGRLLYLRREGERWLVRGARTPAFTVTYDEMVAAAPSRITIRAGSGEVTAEVRLRVSQVDRNPQLGPEAFEIDVPADAEPITIEELREAGPLGDKR